MLFGDQMDDKKVIPHPGDMDAELFRQAAHSLADWISDHLSNLDKVQVLPDCSPGDIIKQLPAHAPQIGESIESIIKDFQDIILPGITHWNHPSFFAYFSITGSGPGILGELLSAALNTNAMLWKTCPSATELEQCTLNWLRDLVGLPPEFWGVIYDTASISTMHAIAAAREALNLNIREKGMAGRKELPGLALYTSAHAHSSVEKAAITLGLGSALVRKIEVDGHFRMRTDHLKDTVQADRKAGFLPFCVVATVGTTSTTISLSIQLSPSTMCHTVKCPVTIYQPPGLFRFLISSLHQNFYNFLLHDSQLSRQHEIFFLESPTDAFIQFPHLSPQVLT